MMMPSLRSRRVLYAFWLLLSSLLALSVFQPLWLTHKWSLNAHNTNQQKQMFNAYISSPPLQPYDSLRFDVNMKNTMLHLEKMLDVEKQHDIYPLSQHSHSYNNKYEMVDFLTNNLIDTILQNMHLLHLTNKQLHQLHKWHRMGKSVLFRLESSETCRSNIRQETLDVESDVQEVTEGLFGSTVKKIINKQHVYYHEINVNWRLVAYAYNLYNESLMIASRDSTSEILTHTEQAPFPAKTIHEPLEINVAWLLKHIKRNKHSKDSNSDTTAPAAISSYTSSFMINRALSSCRTPRRNEDVEGAMRFAQQFYEWSQNIVQYLNRLHHVDSSDPIYYQKKQSSQPLPDASVLVSHVLQTPASIITAVNSSDTSVELMSSTMLLNQHRKSLMEQVEHYKQLFPQDTKSSSSPSSRYPLFSSIESSVYVIVQDVLHTLQTYSDGVENIEQLMIDQLLSAVGNQLSSNDFANYMTYHQRDLYQAPYRPQPFVYDVRRPQHFPEGSISIEYRDINGQTSTPPIVTNAASTTNSNPSATQAIYTNIRMWNDSEPMQFRLTAANQISFNGPRYLHTFITHQFAGDSIDALYLNCRTRQLSSFIVLLGVLDSSHSLSVSNAFILQNSAELSIPITVSTLPSAKAFADSIHSLSDEQQRFAKALREMQLSSSIFTIAVIQIKPLLEQLLNLPYDSLTKEIQLTQDLMELFIKYQIPSDLLALQGDDLYESTTPLSTANADSTNVQSIIANPIPLSAAKKIEKVKGYVKNVQDIIQAAKNRLLAEATQEAEYDKQTSREKLRKGNLHSESADYTMRVKLSGSAPMAEPMMAMAPSFMANSMADSVMHQSEAGQPPPTSSDAADTSAATLPSTTPPDSSSDSAQQPTSSDFPSDSSSSSTTSFDVTRLPSLLDAYLLSADTSAAIRPSRLHIGEQWVIRASKQLISASTTRAPTAPLTLPEQSEMKTAAFDLLDALSRSGNVELLADATSLHVILALTHSFDSTLIDTIIKQNHNPIEQLDISMLMINSFVQQVHLQQLANSRILQQLQSFHSNFDSLVRAQSSNDMAKSS